MILGQITDFLDKLGWSYQKMTGSVVRAEHQGMFGMTKVLIHLHTAGLRLAINPVLERPLESGGWNRSAAHLIKSLNRESPSIRIGFDRQGDLYVKVDLVNQALSVEQFTYVLLNLCRVSDQLMVPVLQAQAYEHENLTA